MSSAVSTNSPAAALALATGYQRELVAGLPEDSLAEVGDFTFPDGVPGPLELSVGERTLTIPPAPPDTLELLQDLASNPYARMWARFYDELGEIGSTGRAWRQRMDRIAGEEIGALRRFPTPPRPVADPMDLER